MTLQPSTTTAQPWDRMESESPKAWDAFNVYLQMGAKRSLDDAYAIATDKPRGSTQVSGGWKDWSKKYNWVARAAAWDNHVAAVEQQAILNEAEANALERIKALRAVQGWGLQIIQRADLQNLDPDQARELLPQAIKALDLAQSGLREEYSLPSRPTTERSLQITGDLGSVGAVELEALGDKELLTRIAAKEQGILTDGFDPDAYEVNGRGELIPIEGRS